MPKRSRGRDALHRVVKACSRTEGKAVQQVRTGGDEFAMTRGRAHRKEIFGVALHPWDCTVSAAPARTIPG